MKFQNPKNQRRIRALEAEQAQMERALYAAQYGVSSKKARYIELAHIHEKRAAILRSRIITG